VKSCIEQIAFHAIIIATLIWDYANIQSIAVTIREQLIRRCFVYPTAALNAQREHQILLLQLLQMQFEFSAFNCLLIDNTLLHSVGLMPSRMITFMMSRFFHCRFSHRQFPISSL